MRGISRRQFHLGALGASLAALPACSSMPDAGRTMKLAVAQMQSADGDIEGNLRQATQLAERARADGADLVLFPEFMPTGYALNASIWSAAEPRIGPTARWLAATSRRLTCAIGTSYLEADGDAHFNTFVLAGRDGAELGRVRKETPAALEANFFRGEPNPHMIDTPFGRVGVGICYESYLCSTERYFAAGQPDLILLPHSFPDMKTTGGIASPPGSFVASWHAKRFGVPTAMVNKTGPWSTTTAFGQATGRFPGASAIVDSSGDVLAAMDDQSGVAVRDVSFDPARKSVAPAGCQGELIEDLTKFDWAAAKG